MIHKVMGGRCQQTLAFAISTVLVRLFVRITTLLETSPAYTRNTYLTLTFFMLSAREIKMTYVIIHLVGLSYWTRFYIPVCLARISPDPLSSPQYICTRTTCGDTLQGEQTVRLWGFSAWLPFEREGQLTLRTESILGLQQQQFIRCVARREKRQSKLAVCDCFHLQPCHENERKNKCTHFVEKTCQDIFEKVLPS